MDQVGGYEFCSASEVSSGPPGTRVLPQTDRAVPDAAYPYQAQGIRWLDATKRALLADEPGLGKTMQSCCAADARAIVVCPAAMRVEWQREFARWRPELTSYVVTGTKQIDAGLLGQYDVIIINFDVLAAHVESLTKLPTTTVIVDEAHAVKTLDRLNPKRLAGSKRALAVATLAEATTSKVYFLTGTPLENRPVELWPMLYMMSPDEWQDYVAFGKRYCAGRWGKLPGRQREGWNFTGQSNLAELHERLSARMLRRTKDQLDLPAKVRQTVFVPLDDATAVEYREAVRDFEAWVEQEGGAKAVMAHRAAPAVTRLTALRRLAARGKLEAALEWIVTHAEGTGRPLVVMGHHREVTDGLASTLRATQFRAPSGERRTFRVGRIIGGMNEAERTADKDAFQAGKLDVIVCSIQAAGVGLTLTRASETLFIERPLKPSLAVQAEDRIHRISQKNRCTITYLDAPGTIDQWTRELLADKTSTVAGVVDGVELADGEAEAFVLGRVLGIGGSAEDFQTGQRTLLF
jgi:SNF2 family DNA or RNA helicase